MPDLLTKIKSMPTIREERQQKTASVEPGEGNNGFEQFYKAYWENLLLFASKFTGDRSRAKDILQEIFINIYLNKTCFYKNIDPVFYMQAAILNRVRNYIRDTLNYRKYINLAAAKATETNGLILDGLEAKELLERINEYLLLMPASQRVVFVLKKDKQLTTKQIASILKRPESTVEKQLRKALQALQRHIGTPGGE